MKIIIAGDWHRDQPLSVFRAATEEHIDTIIHAGDLGAFWPVYNPATEAWEPERKHGFTGLLSRLVASHHIDFHFIDGNHDNHDFLDELRGGSRDAVEADGLIYQPRGSRLELGGLTFGFLGGAGSIDRAYREPGISWWAQEQVTEADVDALGTDPLDVLITHEAPAGVDVTKLFKLPLALESEMEISRDLLHQAVEATKPQLVFSGHWHQRLTYELTPSTTVHVLDKEHQSGNAVVLDTDGLSVTRLELLE